MRRSILNFATTLVYTAVTTIVAIRATPLLLHWLGRDRYGAARVLIDAYGYLTLLELGLGGALAPLMAQALGRDDAEALDDTVAAGARGYLRVSLVSVVVGIALTPIVPWFAQGLAPVDVADLRMAWVVGLSAFLALGLLPMRTVVEVKQLGYLVNLMLIAQSLLVTGLSLMLAWRGWGITGQAVGLAVGSWAFNLGVALMAAWQHPGLLRAAIARRPTDATRRALRRLSWPTLVMNLCGRISVLTDNLIVGAVLDARRVTSLYNTQRLATLGQTILLGVGGSAWAGLAELHARGDRATFNRRLVELSRLLAVMAVVGFTPVVAFNRAFVRLWLGPDGPDFAYGGDLVIALAAVNGLLLAQQALWAWCFSATGNVGHLIAPTVAAAALNLAASVFLTRRVGLAGPLMGTTIALSAVGMIALPRLLRRVFATPIGALLGAVGWPLLWGIVSAVGLHALAQRHEPTTWVALALAASASALASLAFCAVAILTPEDRALWATRLRGLKR